MNPTAALLELPRPAPLAALARGLGRQLNAGAALSAAHRLRRQLHVERRFAGSLAVSVVSRTIQALLHGPPSTSTAMDLSLTRRMRALFEEDWRDLRSGVVPPAAAAVPWREYAEAAPSLLLDLPRVWARVRRHDIQDLDPSAVPSRYPRYYARNFHFQTEGYLGHRSARLYDLQVELLFGGCADAMRRRLIPPVVRFAREEGCGAERPMRLLDVACGTGHLLRMFGAALPGARLFGLDLSPQYIAFARARMPRELDVSLVCENAEQLPFPAGHFDAVTCLFLFHELPADVRARVLAEMARVVRPGGLVVIGDTLQRGDAPELDPLLEQFPQHFHEPYYRSYIRERLPESLARAGLRVVDARNAFLTRVTVARSVD